MLPGVLSSTPPGARSWNVSTWRYHDERKSNPLPLGIGQWLVLRQRNLLAGEWVLISSLAFVVGMVIGLPLGGEGREWLSLGVIGLLVGAITGLGMVWSLRRQAALA